MTEVLIFDSSLDPTLSDPTYQVEMRLDDKGQQCGITIVDHTGQDELDMPLDVALKIAFTILEMTRPPGAVLN